LCVKKLVKIIRHNTAPPPHPLLPHPAQNKIKFDNVDEYLKLSKLLISGRKVRPKGGDICECLVVCPGRFSQDIRMFPRSLRVMG
jgi:hypothetical protein